MDTDDKSVAAELIGNDYQNASAWLVFFIAGQKLSS
jgi:hypothetical protein